MPMPVKYLLLFVPLFFASSSLFAEVVSLKVSKGINATAEYHSGEPDKPLVIFIHGFLQTRSFSTVERLFGALHESGYPVLAPTLSLGISNRAQALPCESIHLHSLDDDAVEIDEWVKWAAEKGFKEVVLIGHSAGSVNITAYLSSKQHPLLKKTILVSLTHYGPDRPAAFERKEHGVLARKMLEKSDDGLATFALAYCKEYVSTAKNFLSYYEWSVEDVLEAISSDVVENYVIIGSEDERIKGSWLKALQKSEARVIVTEGASHFFDQSHEFDLLDSVEEILADEY